MKEYVKLHEHLDELIRNKDKSSLKSFILELSSDVIGEPIGLEGFFPLLGFRKVPLKGEKKRDCLKFIEKAKEANEKLHGHSVSYPCFCKV